ncbi:lysine decarboxylase 1 [Klebsiella michiganensis]|uniref:Lysine decarboxylase 1 n=1 Tax=Klebsiella michiganensis TaxID=1134687 RepID=A0A7H4LY69_9ENTR|nr:lysine decarboxylase 1 [Klebsiella michiganensis]
MLPSLYREDPEFYENMRVQELAQNIHKLIEHHNLPDLMFRAFEVLPTMMITPYAAFQKELHGQTEEVYLEEMGGPRQRQYDPCRILRECRWSCRVK